MKMRMKVKDGDKGTEKEKEEGKKPVLMCVLCLYSNTIEPRKLWDQGKWHYNDVFYLKERITFI